MPIIKDTAIKLSQLNGIVDISLIDIKKIMDNPNYDKGQALLAQKSLLEKKRNRLNGIIELITDVMEGVNTMSFGAFCNKEVQKMVNHTLECMSKESLDEQVQKYGSKEKAIEAVMQSTGNTEEIKQEQEENVKIYKQFMSAKEAGNMDIFVKGA